MTSRLKSRVANATTAARAVARAGSVAVCCALVLEPTVGAAGTLFDAIDLAYRSSPYLHAQEAELRSTDEDYVQAKSQLGPQISLNGQADYQGARVQQPASFFTPKTTTNYLTGNASADLSLTQPLFTNGQIAASVRAAAADVRAGRQSLRQAEGQLLLAVITAYMDVRRDREVIDILGDEIDGLKADVAEQEAKGKLGASSKTDVAQSHARLLATQAELSQARGRLEVSASEYLNIVGENPGDLAPEPELPNLPATVDDAFSAADKNNPQLLSALDTELAARHRVTQAKGATGPTVSLKIDAAVAPVEPFIPNQYDQSVTAAVVVNQPIFTSGLAGSRVRKAADDDARAAFEVDLTRRSIDQQVAQSWSQLTSAESAEALQLRQVEVEKIAVEGNRIEERAGLRTTVDLLNAESELANNRENLAQAHHDAYVAKATLLSTMGMLEARYLLPRTPIYDPVKPLNKVKDIDAPIWEGAVAATDASAPVKTGPPQALTAPGAAAERYVEPKP